MYKGHNYILRFFSPKWANTVADKIQFISWLQMLTEIILRATGVARTHERHVCVDIFFASPRDISRYVESAARLKSTKLAAHLR